MPRSNEPRHNPGDAPARTPTAPGPTHDDAGAPGPSRDKPDEIERPPAREPGPPPVSDSGGVGNEIDVPHEGATEEQVGDRTGPGVGYDEELTRKR